MPASKCCGHCVAASRQTVQPQRAADGTGLYGSHDMRACRQLATGGGGRPGLQVLHGVPVMLQEDDSVSCSEVEAQAPHMGSQQQHLNGGVAVEALHYTKSLLGLHTAGHPYLFE